MRSLLASLALALCAASSRGQTRLIEAFESDGFDTWAADGSAFGLAPVPGRQDGVGGEFRNYGDTYLVASGQGGDDATGSLTSPPVRLDLPYLAFLVAGGNHPGRTAVQLLVDGQVVRQATGNGNLTLGEVVWDISEFLGKQGVIRILDSQKGSWGIIAADHFVLSADPRPKLPAGGRPRPAASAQLTRVAGEGSAAVAPGVDFRVAATRERTGVTSPTAITLGNDGTLLVAETHRFRFGIEDDRNHLYWYLDDLAAATTADRVALHRKWDARKPVRDLTERSEVIRRLDQEGPDGAFARGRVFSDGYNDLLDGTAAGILAWDDTVYFACIPKIWMLRDGGPDGREAARAVVQDGFGVRISLSGHDLNGFVLGPDGRIWGTLGDRGFNGVTQEGTKVDLRNQGAVFRMEPDGTGLEFVHTGLRNPKEIAFDELGHAVSVDNNSDQGDSARVVHIVDGADSGWEMEHQAMHTFHREIGLEQRPASRWMNEKLWHLPNADQPAYLLPPVAHLSSGPSGLAHHPGAGFLADEAGRFLICDYRGAAAGSGIWSFRLEPAGAGLRLADHRQLLWGVAATDVEYDWKGRLVVSDFVGGWESHPKGRILTLVAKEPHQPKAAAEVADLIRDGFSKRPPDELARLLAHPDQRVRLRAQVELTRRPGAAERLAAATRSANRLERLHGVWGLGILARRGAAILPGEAWDNRPSPLAPEPERAAAARLLLPLLKDADADIRAQAVRALGESPLRAEAIGLGSLLADTSPRVRLQAALAAARLADPSVLPQVTQLIRANADRDPTLRHAGAFALERLALSPEAMDRLASDPSASVRLAACVALRRRSDPSVARFLADPDPRVADEAIRAIGDRSLDSVRSQAAALLDNLGRREWNPFILRRLVHGAFRAGGEPNARRLLAAAANPSVPIEVRAEALRLAALWTQPHPVDQLTGHWAPLPARDAAEIRGPLAETLSSLLKGDASLVRPTLALAQSLQVDVAALPAEILLDLAANRALAGATRAKALELWLARNPADLAAVAHRLAKDADDAVAMVAIGQLALLNPAEGLAELAAATRAPSAIRRQGAWKALARLDAPGVERLFADALADLAKSGGVSPVALELMDAAAARKEPAVAKSLADLNAALAAAGPLGKWMPALEGGDAANGLALFQALPAGQCLRCHKASDAAHAAGGEAGPNLAGIAKRADPRELLESVVLPGAKVAPGHGVVSLTLADGASLAGTLLGEHGDHVDIDVAGNRWRVSRKDIRSMTPPVSGMPPMDLLLKPAEVRDLVAWLATLQKAAPSPKSPAPKPYILAK